MGEMIGNISHQWRQPLARNSAMLINLELYSERGKLTHEKLSQKIKDANEQLSFMSDTINDFKNFFSPKTEKKEFSSQEVIIRSCRLLSASLEKYAIDIKFDIEDNFHYIGHPNEIVQLLINILNNAKEAFITNDIKDKKIRISSYSQDGKFIISVFNNGGNIDEKNINNIFNAHFSTKESNSGLGLYMCKMIAQKNSATLHVQNNNDGVVFYITFSQI